MHTHIPTGSRFLPNSSPFEQKNFRALLQRMNGLRFGSFSKLARLREHDFRSLDHLNLSELYQSVSLIGIGFVYSPEPENVYRLFFPIHPPPDSVCLRRFATRMLVAIACS